MSYTRSKRNRVKRRSGTSKQRGGGSRRSKPGAANPSAEDLRVYHGDPRGVFYDICNTTEEAQNFTLRSELMIQIKQIIRSRRLTQNRAAKLFGVTQPRISDLVRGKINLFSLDSLISMLTRAGMAVHLVVKQSAA